MTDSTPFTEAERADLVARIARLYREALFAEGDGGGELAEAARAYEAGLPRVALGRCPLTGEVQFHSFDPFGLDGPWWNHEDPQRPLVERNVTCIALTGAVALAGPVGDVPWLCRPGPGLPYVLPRLLASEGVFATLRQIPVGPHTAWAICYFAAEPPAGIELPNDWGSNQRWDAIDGMPGWSACPEDPAERDFALSPWIARGKLFWIAPGDDTLTLRAELAGCPYVGLPGERREQRIAYGRLRLDGEDVQPVPQPPEGKETIGEFALFELDEGLREELRLPPVPIPVRLSCRSLVFPAGAPVNLLAMLDEVKAFTAAHPELAGGYAAMQASLALVAGMTAAESGAQEQALAAYRTGLEIAPDSIALRSHEALALVALGRDDESRDAMEALVDDMPRGQVLPLVWMLLARRHAADGETHKALTLLDELERCGEGDPAIARFRAGLLAAPGEAEAAPSNASATEAPAAVAETPAPPRKSLPVLPLLLLAAIGIGGFSVWRVLGTDEDAPQASASSPATPEATPSAAPSPSQPPPEDPAVRWRSEIAGIWAPEEGGCASGFGFAFTPAGRYGEGDEYSGEEGNWEITDGQLIERITLSYENPEEAGNPKLTTVSKRYSYVIRELENGHMVLANGEAAMKFVKCPDGRRAFSDGETFP